MPLWKLAQLGREKYNWNELATLKYNKHGSEGKDITKHAALEDKQRKRFLPVSMRNRNGYKNIDGKVKTRKKQTQGS